MKRLTGKNFTFGDRAHLNVWRQMNGNLKRGKENSLIET
jgi:hypothetical protein